MGEKPEQPMFFIRNLTTQELKGPLTVQQLKQWYSRDSVGAWGVSKSPNGPWTPATQVKGLAAATAGPTRLPPKLPNAHGSFSSGGVDSAGASSKVMRAEPRFASHESGSDSLGRLAYDVFAAIKARLLEPRDQCPARRRKPTDVSSERSSASEGGSAPIWAWLFAVGLLIGGFYFICMGITEWRARYLRETALAADRREERFRERIKADNRREQVDADRREQTRNGTSNTRGFPGATTQEARQTPSEEWLKKSGREKSDAVEFIFIPRAGELSAGISLVNNSHTPVWATVSISSSALGESFVDGLLYDIKPGNRKTCTVTWTGPVPADLWTRSVFDVTIKHLFAKLSEDWNGMDLTGVLRPILYVRANDLPRVRSSAFDIRVLK